MASATGQAHRHRHADGDQQSDAACTAYDPTSLVQRTLIGTELKHGTQHRNAERLLIAGMPANRPPSRPESVLGVESSISVNLAPAYQMRHGQRCGLMRLTSANPAATLSRGMPNLCATVAAACVFITLREPRKSQIDLGALALGILSFERRVIRAHHNVRSRRRP